MSEKEMLLREAVPEDSERLIQVVGCWWGAKVQTDFLNKWYFHHFGNTCFVAENAGELVGFVVAFYSQTQLEEAYIRLVAVHPEFRGQGVARALYNRFMQTARRDGKTAVRCVTSPRKKDSVAFHTRLGFTMEPQAVQLDGLPVCLNYDGRGGDRVVFVKTMSKANVGSLDGIGSGRVK